MGENAEAGGLALASVECRCVARELDPALLKCILRKVTAVPVLAFLKMG